MRPHTLSSPSGREITTGDEGDIVFRRRLKAIALLFAILILFLLVVVFTATFSNNDEPPGPPLGRTHALNSSG